MLHICMQTSCSSGKQMLIWRHLLLPARHNFINKADENHNITKPAITNFTPTKNMMPPKPKTGNRKKNIPK